MMSKVTIKRLLPGRELFYRKMFCHFRWLFYPVKSVRKLLLRLHHRFRVGIWILSEKESSGIFPVIAFAGQEKNKNYLTSLIFNGPTNEIYAGKMWRRNIIKKMDAVSQGCSLVILEASDYSHESFGNKGCFFIPCWVSGTVDIPDDILITRKENIKSDLKKIRKYNLQYEVTNNKQEFYNFYHTMYLPYITATHGNLAIPMVYHDMEKKLKDCNLLLIKKDSESIAAQLIVYEKNIPRFWSIGIKDGNTDYLKYRVIGAIEYFTMSYLKQQGYKKAHFGATRAFLNDGVLQHKKKWDLQIGKPSEMKFLVKPLEKSIGVKNFFLRNPFIYMEKNLYHGAVFMNGDQLHSKEDFEKIYKTYFFKGLSRLHVYLFDYNGMNKEELIPSELLDKISLYSADTIFRK